MLGKDLTCLVALSTGLAPTSASDGSLGAITGDMTGLATSVAGLRVLGAFRAVTA